MSFRENKIYTVVFTFIYTFVFILFLAIIYHFTVGKIEANKTLFQKRAILDALNIKFESDKDVPGIYEQTIKSFKAGNKDIFYYENNGKKNYAMIYSGVGLWGTITGVLAVNEDLTRIVGIGIISHIETPGLGGRIEEPWYKNQYRDKLIINDKLSTIYSSGAGDYNKDDGSVDAISGATLTSNLFGIIINKAIPEIKKLVNESVK
jgi:Na+-transporting NADH:ubiquinone oxidoreductase subunit C